ncbi:MAG: ribosome-associated translation inhibitor RaiA [Candidatus Andersenbacteria bacterium]
MDTRITWTKLDHSAALEEYFRHKVEHLEHYLKPILSADLELAHDRHHRKGRVYRAEARLAVAKKTIYASEDAGHPFEAVDLLITKLKKELERFRDGRKIDHSKRRNLRDKEQVERRITKLALRKPR